MVEGRGALISCYIVLIMTYGYPMAKKKSQLKGMLGRVGLDVHHHYHISYRAPRNVTETDDVRHPIRFERKRDDVGSWGSIQSWPTLGRG